MSQSLVNESGGARTPLSGFIAALITLLVVVFFTGLLRELPQPVLAAIVLVAVTGLVQIHALKNIWRFSRQEFAVAAVAFLGVLGSGLLNGVLLGVALSIFLLLGRASRPRVVELGRVPGASFYADLIRHPENQRIEDVLVVRTEGALVYFNVDHVRDRISALIKRQSAPPHLVVLFMGNVPAVDLAGAEMLVDLERTFGRQGISFRLAEVHGPVREALRRLEPSHRSDLAEANQTVDDVLGKWRASQM
jgi:MFS superfamily sulfate permease-like transporter